MPSENVYPNAQPAVVARGSRRLIVCIDGTNNAPTTGRTNVSRLFRMIDKTTPDQLAYYQPGVGTLDPDSPRSALIQRVHRVWDLATAWMIGRHVKSAYTFLMEHYRDGDEIYLFGFSRGAYTCRVLAGMIQRVGLLHPGHAEMLGFAWTLYRPMKAHEAAGRFKKYYGRDVKIRFLGLWDTVRSVGVPWKPRTYPNTFSNSSVEVVRHAIALDERRALYATNLWTRSPPEYQDVKEVWFPGVHADVGGGYTGDDDAGLSTIPLAWMVAEASERGLRFSPVEQKRLLWRKDKNRREIPTPSEVTSEFAADTMHDELLHRRWRIVEHIPLPHRSETGSGQWSLRWHPHRSAPRPVPPQTFVHASVRERMERVSDYRPINLAKPVPDDRIVG